MIENICNALTEKIKNKMPEMDNERAEIINYGLQLIIGEIPKTFVLAIISYFFGVLELSILALLIIIPYRAFSGGVHLKTHIGCIISTSAFYTGGALLSKYIIIKNIHIKYLIVIAIWCFSMIMIKLYAPADTEAVPILRKKERKLKKILSYITMTMTLIAACIIKNSTISNLLIIETFFQTIMITKFVYKLTNNKYGHEEYYANNSLRDTI